MDKDYAKARLAGRQIMWIEWSDEFLMPIGLVLDDGTTIRAEGGEDNKGGWAFLKIVGI